MQIFKVKTVIQATRTDVWKVFTDPATWATWYGGPLLSVDPAWQAGASLIWEFGGPSSLREVRTLEHVAIQASDGLTASWRFSDQDGQTLVEMEKDFRGSRNVVSDPSRQQRQCDKEVQGLKEYVEKAFPVNPPKPDATASSDKAESAAKTNAEGPSAMKRASAGEAAARSLSRNRHGSVISLAGSIALIAGLFLTWVDQGRGLVISITGWAFVPFHTRFVLALGITCGLVDLLNIVGAVANKTRSIVVLLGGLASVALMLFLWFYISDNFSKSDIIWSFQKGFWLCSAGSMLLVVGSLLNRRSS